MAAALLLAVVVGVNLGNAAIDGINPVHFQPREAPRQRPIAVETEPVGLSRRLPSYADLYGWEEGNRALAADCTGCSAGAGTYSASVPYFGSREELEGIRRAELREIDRDYRSEMEAMEHRASAAEQVPAVSVPPPSTEIEAKPVAEPEPAPVQEPAQE